MNRSIVARTQEDVFEEVGFGAIVKGIILGDTDIPGGIGNTRWEGGGIRR
ncbi:hypothetical protein AM1_G0060 (plasmid) [Acaryochloris marina MBIC11017]|uniref:Uncharacterized protein n=1 Tax=Acaryochloris marina (strain MBIC 11017) TaxID=329726 RepID=A8ZQF4_ACAM1|nr:hypothetical protein AM1_G0060 [Acaryochloris marina MBIC11017]